MRVLLVDNDPEWLDLLALDLSCEEHEIVDRLLSGTRVAEVVAAGGVDAVVVDYRMPPGPNGLEVTKTLRAQHPDVRVVMFSNYDDPTLVRAVEAAGAAFVLKPALRTLRKLLG
jgi:DNA-binding NarL/FixJ family response regulator